MAAPSTSPSLRRSRRLPTLALLAVIVAALSLVAASCGSDDTKDQVNDALAQAKKKADEVKKKIDQSLSSLGVTTTVGGSGASSGSEGGPTASVRFVNVRADKPGGSTIDIFARVGTGWTKVVDGLAYGQMSNPTKINVRNGGANLQVTASGEQPDQAKFFNNLLVDDFNNGADKGLVIIGWDPSAGADGSGGTASQVWDLTKDENLQPTAGKVHIRVSQVGSRTTDNATVLLAVAGKGCLGDDGLNEPTVDLDPGSIGIQGVKVETSTGSCQGDVVIPPATIDGTAGSTWLVTLFGSDAASMQIAAFQLGA